VTSAGTALTPGFWARDALVVAPSMLGKRWTIGECQCIITEVEAYTADDPASHSFRGATPRNAMMFGPAGRLYVYLSYGMHFCANVVTGEVGDGQAVLIRAVRPLVGIELMRSRRPGRTDRQLADGPGKLTQALGIDAAMNGHPVAIFDDGVPVVPPEPGPRVGISKAVDWPRRWRL
jgi:DNA-3-methyladenine glycosylase